MRNIIHLPIAALSLAAMCTVTSCGKQDVEPEGEARIPIMLSGKRHVTRAAHIHNATDFSLGDKVYAYVYHSERGELIEDGFNNELTVQDGQLFEHGIQMYFPHPYKPVNVFMSHPSLTPNGEETFPTQITHTVKTDQTTEDNHCASDLMYAGITGVEKGETTEITFFHVLSKVRIALIPSSVITASDLVGATLYVNGTKVSGTFKPKMENVTTVASAGDVTASSKAGDVKDIQLTCAVSTNVNNLSWNEAVVFPQELAKGSTFITLRLKGKTEGEEGVTLVYKLPETLKMKGGYGYEFKVNVTPGELNVKGKISKWIIDGEPIIVSDLD